MKKSVGIFIILMTFLVIKTSYAQKNSIVKNFEKDSLELMKSVLPSGIPPEVGIEKANSLFRKYMRARRVQTTNEKTDPKKYAAEVLEHISWNLRFPSCTEARNQSKELRALLNNPAVPENIKMEKVFAYSKRFHVTYFDDSYLADTIRIKQYSSKITGLNLIAQVMMRVCK